MLGPAAAVVVSPRVVGHGRHAVTLVFWQQALAQGRSALEGLSWKHTMSEIEPGDIALRREMWETHQAQLAPVAEVCDGVVAVD